MPDRNISNKIKFKKYTDLAKLKKKVAKGVRSLIQRLTIKSAK